MIAFKADALKVKRAKLTQKGFTYETFRLTMAQRRTRP
jgi:hypothetical protein